MIKALETGCGVKDLLDLYLRSIKDGKSNKVIVDSQYSKELYDKMIDHGLYRGAGESFELDSNVLNY